MKLLLLERPCLIFYICKTLLEILVKWLETLLNFSKFKELPLPLLRLFTHLLLLNLRELKSLKTQLWIVILKLKLKLALLLTQLKKMSQSFAMSA